MEASGCRRASSAASGAVDNFLQREETEAPVTTVECAARILQHQQQAKLSALKNEERAQELEHKERMRALELKTSEKTLREETQYELEEYRAQGCKRRVKMECDLMEGEAAVQRATLQNLQQVEKIREQFEQDSKGILSSWSWSNIFGKKDPQTTKSGLNKHFLFLISAVALSILIVGILGKYQVGALHSCPSKVALSLMIVGAAITAIILLAVLYKKR